MYLQKEIKVKREISTFLNLEYPLVSKNVYDVKTAYNVCFNV